MSFQIINPTVDIVIIAFLLSLLSIIIQVKFLNWKETRRLQKSTQEKNKKAMELMKKGDEHSKREAEEIQKQIMQDMQLQFKNMPKQLIVNMIVFLPPFMLIRELYSSAGYLITLPFDIPILGMHLGWFKWYAICSLIFGLIMNTVLGKLEEKGKI